MNIMTPIDCYTGYGITGYNIWRSFYKNDDKTCLFLIGKGNAEISWDNDNIQNSLIYNKINFNKQKPSLKIWHCNDFFVNPLSSNVSGLSFFEIDKLSDIEKESLNCLDIIFMPSDWAKNILIENGIKKPIHTIPMGVDTNLFNAYEPEDKQKDKYIFINIGKWEVRKGHDILVDAFNKAFSDKDNVELWMINHNVFLHKAQQEDWIQKYKTSKLGDKIIIYPRIDTQKTLSKLMAYADCGVFPSRAEGWNNEALEMMAMNRPIIITNYSAHSQYCTKDNSYLIDISKLEPANDDIWFRGDGNWAYFGEDQLDQLVEHMRYVYSNNIRNNQNGLQTALSLTWDSCVSKIQKYLC